MKTYFILRILTLRIEQIWEEIKISKFWLVTPEIIQLFIIFNYLLFLVD